MATHNIVLSLKDLASSKLSTFTSNIKKTVKSVSDLEASFKTIQQASLGLIKAGTTLTATVLFPSLIASNFESAMAEVESVFGDLPVESFKKLEDAAKKSGETTVFSATQSAKALAELARAGFSVEESIAALPTTTRIAIASLTDLNEAASITADAIRQYGFEGENAFEKVGDVLIKTTQTSNQKLFDLREALNQVAPLAKSMGISFEELNGTLAIFANSGIRGSRAGVALKNVLLGLIRGSGPAAITFRELGIATKDAQGNFIGLGKSFELLSSKIKELGNVDQAQVLEKIFGRRGILAGAKLIENLSGAEKSLESYIKVLENAGGTAEKTAKKMQDTLRGSFIELKSATEGLLITIGKPLLKTLTDLVRKVTSVVRSIKEFALENRSTITTMIKWIAIIGTTTIAIGALGATISSVSLFIIAFKKGIMALWAVTKILRYGMLALTFAVKGLSIAFGILFSPIGAIILLLGSLVIFIKRDVIGAFEVFGWRIKDFFARIIAEIRLAFFKMIDAVMSYAEKIYSFFGETSFSRLIKNARKFYKSKIRESKEILYLLDRERKYWQRLNNQQEKSSQKRKKIQRDRLKELEDEIKSTPLEQDSPVKFQKETYGETVRKNVAELETALSVAKSKLTEVEILVEQGNESVKKVFEQKRKLIEISAKKDIANIAKKQISEGFSEEEKGRQEDIIYEKRVESIIKLAEEERKINVKLQDEKRKLLKQIENTELNIKKRTTTDKIVILQIEQQEALKKIDEKHLREMENAKKLFIEKVITETEFNNLVKTQIQERASLQKQQEEQIKKETSINTLENKSVDANIQYRQTLSPEDKLESDLASQRLKNEEELLMLREKGASELQITETIEAQKRELYRITEKYRQAQLEKTLRMSKTAFSSMEEIFSGLYEATGGKVKEFFYIQKAASIAQATINVAEGVTKAIGQGGIAGIALGAIVGAAGAVQIAKIASETPPAFERGGKLTGGSGRKDDTVFLGMAGEYIIKKASVEKYGIGLIESINNGTFNVSMSGIVPSENSGKAKNSLSFASGGLIPEVKQLTPKQNDNEKQKDNPAIVNILDPQLFESYLASDKGQNAFINFITNNREMMRGAILRD